MEPSWQSEVLGVLIQPHTKQTINRIGLVLREKSPEGILKEMETERQQAALPPTPEQLLSESVLW